MTTDQARQIVALFVAAYPGSPADENTVALWLNALAVADYDAAHNAAMDTVRTSSWWPTIAEFNGRMTAIRRDEARRATPATIDTRMRCDGSGWIDAHDGQRPCPLCNPWLATQHAEGDLRAAHRQQAPKDYVMPAPCRQEPAGRFTPPERGFRLALEAYVEACAEEGRPPTKAIVAMFEAGRLPGVTPPREDAA